MSIKILKQELTSLGMKERRRMIAFLVSLQNGHDKTHQKDLAKKIDRPASRFATLEELDRRLGLTTSGKRS